MVRKLAVLVLYGDSVLVAGAAERHDNAGATSKKVKPRSEPTAQLRIVSTMILPYLNI